MNLMLTIFFQAYPDLSVSAKERLGRDIQRLAGPADGEEDGDAAAASQR